MPSKASPRFDATRVKAELEAHDHKLGLSIGWMFEGLSLYIDRPQHVPTDLLNGEGPAPTTPLDLRLQMASNAARFASARLADDLEDETITHVVVGDDRSRVRSIRETIAR